MLDYVKDSQGTRRSASWFLVSVPFVSFFGQSEKSKRFDVCDSLHEKTNVGNMGVK